MVGWYDLFEPKVAAWEASGDIGRLITGLTDRDPEVRCLSYDALGRLRRDVPETREAICQALYEENSSSVRSRGAVALTRLGGNESLNKLRDLLIDPDGEVRAEATRGLGKQQDSNMLSVFCALLDDEYERVVTEAIYALSWLGNYRAVTALHRLFDHCTKEMRELASNAINSINLNQPLAWPDDDVFFFTYAFRGRLACECYSYKLIAWRNYLRRRWRYPFAHDWGIGYWEMSTMAEQLTERVLRPGYRLELIDRRS